MTELEQARQGWEKEWLAQTEINDYRNWLEHKLFKARSRELAAYLECCKAVCYYCEEEGLHVEELNSVVTANGDPYWHILSKDRNLYVKCKAASIRSLPRFQELQRPMGG